MVLGLIIGAVAIAGIIGVSIFAYQKGEAEKIKAQGEAKGIAQMYDEIADWLPWVLIAIACVIGGVFLAYSFMKAKTPKAEGA